MRIWIGFLAATGLATAFWACGDAPSAPSRPPDPVPKTLTALRIIGPSSLPPGAAGQFTAAGTYSDGSTADLTTGVTWNSSNRDVLLITASGSATTLAPGESNVTAFGPARSSAFQNVLVLEPGTYRVSGTVREAGNPVEGAVVEVVEGIGAGLKARTLSLGRYELYGLAGQVLLRASATGFNPATRAVVVGDNTSVSDFDLAAAVRPADIGGQWILTFAASPECRDRLSEDARNRSFDTTITQQSTLALLTIENPASRVVVRLRAQIVDRSLTFELGKFSYYGEPGHELFERLDAERWLGIAGKIEGTLTGQEIRGTLNGEFVTYASTPSRFAFQETGACFAATHVFTLRRP